MSFFEYSIIYFDNCVINFAQDRTVINVIESLVKSFNLPIVYSLKIKMTGVDCYSAIEFLQKALKQREIDFPTRKQVLIIVYDNPFVDEPIKLVKFARNCAFFTKDLRGWSPQNEKITDQQDIGFRLNSTLDNVDGLNYSESNSTYIDNYIYFSALWSFSGNNNLPVLFHVSPQVTENEMFMAFEKLNNYFLNLGE